MLPHFYFPKVDLGDNFAILTIWRFWCLWSFKNWIQYWINFISVRLKSLKQLFSKCLNHVFAQLLHQFNSKNRIRWFFQTIFILRIQQLFVDVSFFYNWMPFCVNNIIFLKYPVFRKWLILNTLKGSTPYFTTYLLEMSLTNLLSKIV